MCGSNLDIGSALLQQPSHLEGGKYDKDVQENALALEEQFSVLDRKFDIAKAWVHFANAFFKSFFAADGRAHLAGEKLEQGGGFTNTCAF